MAQYLRVVPASRLRHFVADGRTLFGDPCAMPREVPPSSGCRSMIVATVFPNTSAVRILLVSNRPKMYPSRGSSVTIGDYSSVLFSLNAAGKYLRNFLSHPRYSSPTLSRWTRGHLQYIAIFARTSPGGAAESCAYVRLSPISLSFHGSDILPQVP